MTPPNIYLSLFLRHTHLHTNGFQTLKCETDHCISRQTNQLNTKEIHTSSHCILSNTSGDKHTHCHAPRTLSNLKQPRGKKSAEEKGRGKKPNNVSIFPFPGKRRTQKHCFQELLVVRGPLVRVCTYTHLQLPSVLRKHP